jgi:hypothetical protein
MGALLELFKRNATFIAPSNALTSEAEGRTTNESTKSQNVKYFSTQNSIVNCC